MSFFAPMALYFAALLPVVVVFYLLKRKRVVRLVSSTLLWQKFLTDTQASAPFQKLRHNWLLVLQLLMLALAVFALARPYVAGEQRPSRLRVVVLDASASMQSTDVAPSRFEAAKAEALRWVDELEGDQEILLLLAAANTEVKQSATSDKPRLRRALEGCEVTDGPTRLVEALKLAGTLTQNRDDAEIHLFSDGALSGLDELEIADLPLVFHKVGDRCDNVGVVSVDVRANPEDASQRALFVNVVNYSTNLHRGEVEVRLDEDLLEVRAVTVEPTNALPLVFIVGQTNDGVFSVLVKVADDLAVDNRVSMVSLMPRPVHALLVTAGNRFLEKAVRAPGNVRLEVAPRLVGDGSDYDVVILDNVVPSTWPTVNTLAIHTVTSNLFSEWGTMESPVIVDWRSSHPLLRFVNFDDLSIGEAIEVKPPSWGISLVDAPRAPLIIAGEYQRARLLWIAFDTLDSMWPVRLSFPIFFANAVDWLNPASVAANQLMVRAGDPFRLALAEDLDSAVLVGPDGERADVAVRASSRDLIVGETTRQGVYRLEAGTNRVTFCVNLTDGEESNTQPRAELPMGRYGVVAAAGVVEGNREIWRWLGAAALAVLLFEWWYYHRRTA